jgi:hypothetical protein
MKLECGRELRRLTMLLCLMLAVLPSCRATKLRAPSQTDPVPTAAPTARAFASAPSGDTAEPQISGHPLSAWAVVGQPAVVDNLTVFPILAKRQAEIGPITTLPAALAQGKAEVRELGDADLDSEPAAHSLQQVTPPAATQRRTSREQVQQVRWQGGAGPRVGTLVIDNRGEIPIYVLAGTVVKGGKQDRQIAQDFIVGPGETVSVDAFCVEHGRWSGRRGGVRTDGKFKTAEQLATSDVRAAGQYEQNQSKVWDHVSKVNRAKGKATSTGSLFATLDDASIRGERDALARRVLGHLDQVNPQRAVVGMAYAVDGRIRGVRWFAHHRIFQLFRSTLVNTSALDAIVARAGGPVRRSPALQPRAVADFIAEVDAAEQKRERATAAENVNTYSESESGYGSKTRLKSKKGKGQVEVSSDYVAK